MLYDSAQRAHPFVEEFRETLRYRELVWQWAGRNIKLRYKRSVLGVFWTLLEPLLLMTILAVVFSQAFRMMLPAYPVHLLAGLVLFDFFNRSTLLIVEEIIASQSLARRIYVPRSAFAVAAILTFLVHWAIAHLPLVAIAVLFDRPLGAALLTVPIGMALTAVFALGVGLAVATLGAFFHDVRLTYQVALAAWFYATPVIYPLSMVPDAWREWFRLNPLFHFLELVRMPIYDGVAAPPTTWAVSAAWAFGAALAGWWVFTRARGAIDLRA